MKIQQSARTDQLLTALQNRILVLDGAMGTSIQGYNLTEKDFGGAQFDGCNEYLNLTRPDVIKEIVESYLKAGCDIIETNTFGGTELVLNEYDLGHRAREINESSAVMARELAQKYSTPEKPRFVAGAIGPTTKAISVTGGITFEELIRQFYGQAYTLGRAEVDYFLVETCQDTRNIKAALLGIDQANKELGKQIPVAVSGTIEPMGTMLGGQPVDALYASLAHRNLLYLGLNCATGPEFMTDHIRELARLSHFRVGCVPNAGLPDEHGCYLESPKMVTAILERFMTQGWVNVVGGCCGTHAGHIQAMVELANRHKPRSLTGRTDGLKRSFLSGLEYLEITDEMRPVIVGERTNVIGSKKFKEMIIEEKFDEASDIARAQVKNGAQIIDACLANPDRDELSDMNQFLEQMIKKIKAPIMIDSTDEKVLASALTYCQGKAIINSVNLEDGEERFEKVIPLARQFGAALVVGTIDDDPQQGMAVTRTRKLEVAERSFNILTQKYGVDPCDIYWDPLVFPCATGDAQYVGSAVETIEGIRLIKAKYPQTKTVLGISNVSFGLPAAGREVLNSVYLYHCVQAGLDLAIVNSEKLVRYSGIPAEEIELANNLLWNRGADPIAAFAAHFRTKKPVNQGEAKALLPLMERIPRYIIEGSKDGLAADLTLALQELKPLEIINGPLMKGMDEVGRLFNANQLIVAEVLQSAEAMKAAVAHLEPHMEKNESSSRGKIVLATVKGDVHDIGKNLVEIILSNNGFEVVNLGIKVPPEQLIAAVKQHKPDMVGLSGLLVKSAQQMVITADDFSRAGVDVPILVGGAALSQTFVDKQIARAYTTGSVSYASDAMHGLELAKKVVSPQDFDKLKKEQNERREKLWAQQKTEVKAAPIEISMQRSNEISILDVQSLPKPSDFNRHILKSTPIEQIWDFINPLMLYGRHLGIKGGTVKKLERIAAGESALLRDLNESEKRSLEIWEEVEKFKQEHRGHPWMHPKAVFSFYEARTSHTHGNTLILKDPALTAKNSEVLFEFPRQKRENGICLTDYVRPSKTFEGDSVACFLVSVGEGVREGAEAMKKSGDYLRSHILQALALESAEAYAEYLHSQLRRMWGFPDPTDMTMMERFQAKYQGKRYSFGYPACPRLDDQTQLFELLNPSEIGVQLTDGFMMDPEASVSAMVFHHTAATYFSVGSQIGDNRLG